LRVGAERFNNWYWKYAAIATLENQPFTISGGNGILSLFARQEFSARPTTRKHKSRPESSAAAAKAAADQAAAAKAKEKKNVNEGVAGNTGNPGGGG
jgi:hypothetical protein